MIIVILKTLSVIFLFRILVSARHKGTPLGLLEYNKDGECISRITDHIESLKTIVAIISGNKHVLLCSNGGNMGMIRLKKSNTWSSPSLMELHQSTVLLGTSMTRSGIDFFFTVDKYSNVGVCIFDSGRLIKSILNPTFANSTISCVSSCANFIYLGQTDGVLLVIDIGELLDGDFKVATNLKQKIIFCGDIFSNKTSITSLAVLAGNAYFELPTEDPVQGRKWKPRTRVSKAKSNKNNGLGSGSILNSALYGDFDDDIGNSSDACLEGHLVLVGGGDGDPRVRVMRVNQVFPKVTDAVETGRQDGKAEPYTIIQEIAILRGHTRSVSGIIVDAAGRYIISASKDDRMFLVWDAFTFTCEKLCDDIDIGSIHGGLNSLFICSFKPPYLTIFTVPKERIEGWQANDAVADDGRPEIGMVRTNLWCTASVKGGVAIPSKSTIRATQYLGDRGRSVVECWQKYHGVTSNDEYKGGAGNANPSTKTVLSKDIKSAKLMTRSESLSALESKSKVALSSFVPAKLNIVNDSGSNFENFGNDNVSETGSDPWQSNIGGKLDHDIDNKSERTQGSSDHDIHIKERVEQDDDNFEFQAEQEEQAKPLFEKHRYLRRLHSDQGNQGLVTSGLSDEEEFEMEKIQYPSAARNPFDGAIVYESKNGIHSKRLKKFNNDGDEYSINESRKAHFSDSGSDDDRIVIVPTNKKMRKKKRMENILLGNYESATPAVSHRRRIPQKPKRGVIHDFKDAESSDSDK